ncbi:hypothetical protein, partial [Sulfitobacter sp.]|uniref:hypothetical protein n=1 Tax=Sulfitobacter sp. TaxID=1903071 RepID=UPI003001F494
MTLTVISGNDTVAQSIDGDDQFILLEDASLVVTGNSRALSVTGDDNNVIILGDFVSAGTQNAIVSSGGTGNSYTFGANAVLSFANDFFNGMNFNSDNETITNHGQIYGSRTVVFLGGSNDVFINYGIVAGASTTFETVRMGDANQTLVNHGSVTSGAEAVVSVGLNSGIVNFGQIVGTTAIQANTGSARITNHGDLTGTTGTAVSMTSTDAIFTNFGTVSGDVTAQQAVTVRNAGLIDGDVITNGSSDVMVNSGTITGSVDLGTGNDIYRGFGGTVLGTIDGGADDDTYFIDQPDAVINDLSG